MFETWLHTFCKQLVQSISSLRMCKYHTSEKNKLCLHIWVFITAFVIFLFIFLIYLLYTRVLSFPGQHLFYLPYLTQKICKKAERNEERKSRRKKNLENSQRTFIELNAFFISNTFTSNAVRLKSAKNQAKPKQHPEAEL